MKIELVLSRSERVSAEITPSHHTAHLLTLRLSPVHRQSSQALNTKRLHAGIKIEKKGKVQRERERFSLLQRRPLAHYQLVCVREESGCASLPHDETINRYSLHEVSCIVAEGKYHVTFYNIWSIFLSLEHFDVSQQIQHTGDTSQEIHKMKPYRCETSCCW